jgi:TRAP-type transport system small permease protein
MVKANPIELIAKHYDNLLLTIRILIGVLMLAAIAINFANVIARRIFDAPFIWAEEIMIYIIVWMVYFGAVLVSWHGRHLRMDLLSSNLKGWPGLFVNWLALLIMVGLSLFVVFHSYNIILTFISTGQESIAASIPMYIPHIAIPIGFLLIFIGTIIGAKWQCLGRPPPTRHHSMSEQAAEEN